MAGAEATAELLAELLRRTHLSAPGDLARVVADQARTLGAEEVDLYLIDYELSALMPLPSSPDDEREVIPVTGTIAGRAYTMTTIVQSSDAGGGLRRVWLPLMDGTERIGVMAAAFRAAEISDDTVAVLERYAHLVAMLVVAKGAYSDVFELTRRARSKSIASELIWELTPPLVFATDNLVVAGLLEPSYDNGGDALDYSLDGDVLRLAMFDAMGHGLTAAGLATFALSAYRHSRRRGYDLVETYASMDAAIETQFPGEGFVTGLVAELNIVTGQLSWLSAGHPPPLMIRNDRRARMLAATPATPLGVPSPAAIPAVAHESLEPGDMVMLYTDGLTEAHAADGERLAVDGLCRFVERQAANAQTAPETLRRLRHAIVDAQPDELADDATALLVEWKRGTEQRLLPPTV
jgi:stage II sporulation SpoE-like protein